MVFELVFALATALILFLYGIENFSSEIQKVAGQRFREILSSLTQSPLKGSVLGALVTAMVQSSTATTIIAVGLVNAGTISFAQSLGVIFGANVGTTITAQLVALKLTSFAPVFIILGFLTSIVGGRYKFLGKPLFYFGLVFFSLTLMSSAIEPFKTDPVVINYFSSLSNVFVAVLAGLVFTAIVQSSSVTTGVVVLLASGGLITLSQGIPLLLGTNIGTTITSFFASSRMSLHAKRSAVAHLFFNLGGALLFFPFIGPLAGLVESFGGSVAQQVANAHLVFNVLTLIVFLVFLNQFKKVIERVVPGKEEEILIKTKFLQEQLPEGNKHAFKIIEKELSYSLIVTRRLFEEASTLLADFEDKKLQRVVKLEALNDFLDEKIEAAIVLLSKRKLDKNEAMKTALLVRISNSIEQLADLGKVFAQDLRAALPDSPRFSEELKGELKSVFDLLDVNLIHLSGVFPAFSAKEYEKMKRNDNKFREASTRYYSLHLERMQSDKKYYESHFVELLSVMETANAKTREARKFSKKYASL
ncbi:MAG: Na/Pi cotransporter family protein [Candidatus Micrarchaeia archaeon]